MTQRDKINNCGTSNVVYLITCNACSVSYVGETGNQLRTRLNNHRSDIRHYNDTQVARHFNEAGHSYADLLITILESLHFTLLSLKMQMNFQMYTLQEQFNQGHFLTTPHWIPSTDGTMNTNGLQDLKLGSQEV